MSRIQIVQHVPFEGPGFIAHWAEHRGYELRITRPDLGDGMPDASEFDLLVILGGPMGVGDIAIHPWLAAEIDFVRRVEELGRPILGICLGAQIMASAFGAPVVKNREKEIGWYPIQRDPAISSSLASVFPPRFWAFHWHGETFGIPGGAESLGESEACANQGFIWKGKSVALQFHLEATSQSIQELIDNAGSELSVRGTYIQDPDRIFAGFKEHGKQVNTLMALLLDRML